MTHSTVRITRSLLLRQYERICASVVPLSLCYSRVSLVHGSVCVCAFPCVFILLSPAAVAGGRGLDALALD